jgi:hypothetical protein
VKSIPLDRRQLLVVVPTSSIPDAAETESFCRAIDVTKKEAIEAH